LVLASPATADGNLDEAKRHYQLGEAHFAAQRFAAARAEWEQSYKLAPSPVILHNIGLAFEREGLPHEALAMYRRAAVDPSLGLTEKIRNLERSLAAAPPATVPPTVQTPPTQHAAPQRSRKIRTIGWGMLAVGIASTVAGSILLGATASAARSLEQEPRSGAQIELALAQRDRLEASGVALISAGPLLIVGGSLTLYLTR
jgi:tetratricopeptide (TPR) repeat protein